VNASDPSAPDPSATEASAPEPSAPDPDALDPDALARACADAMWAEDVASQQLGMRIVDVGAGRATVAMPLRAEMLNGHGIAHGGFVFALADSAFAFACNSRNVRSVAYACVITFLAPVGGDEELVASAVEQSLVGRTGTYDVTVTASGQVVAEFRGNSRTVGGSL